MGFGRIFERKWVESVSTILGGRFALWQRGAGSVECGHAYVDVVTRGAVNKKGETAMKTRSYKDLIVWQKSMDFAVEVIHVSENINADRKHYRLIEQLESAASSVVANISEGKGRYSKKEFLKFLYIARGSLYETITFLILFNRKRWINDSDLDRASTLAEEINKMLSGLINAVKRSL